MNQTYELLAPAGNRDCLNAAMEAGADAVYLAGQSFGARAYAGNFSEEELLDALDYVHCLHKKIYLTLNTLIKEKEFPEVLPFLKPYYEAGLDGIIVQDPGLIPLLRKSFPGLPLHASTQMTVNSFRSAKWLKEQGFERVVPSRELSLTELKEIREKAGMEVECFIHGALCYCYSGQCYFSSFLGGRSGNRGRCAGPCRLPYEGIPADRAKTAGKRKKREIYPLSLKDLCSLPYIYDLMDAGIDSFKIEGRMKSPEYVAGVTSIYRKYMDAYIRMNGCRDRLPEIDPGDMEILQKLYIRSSIQDGYLKKHNGRDMISLSSPSYTGSDEKILKKIQERYCSKIKKIPIDAEIVLKKMEPSVLNISDGSCYVHTEGATSEKAQNRPVSEEDVKKQLNKTGQSIFTFRSLKISMEPDLFLPLKSLNELRRAALEGFRDQLLRSYRREAGPVPEIHQVPEESFSAQEKQPELQISVMKKEQLAAVYDWLKLRKESGMANIGIRLYLPCDLCVTDSGFLENAKKMAEQYEFQCFCVLPRIFRKRSEFFMNRLKEMLPEIPGLLVRNLEELQWTTEQNYQGVLVSDYTIYQWNRSAMQFLRPYFDEFTYPLELSEREILDCGNTDGSYFVYGRVPMMVSANCVKNTLDRCTKQENDFSYSLLDRYHKKLPLYCNCIHCYNEIYNAVPTSLHKELPQLIKKGFRCFRLDFTDETRTAVKNVCDFYLSALAEENSGGPETKKEFPVSEYTTGHLKEGAQ